MMEFAGWVAGGVGRVGWTLARPFVGLAGAAGGWVGGQLGVEPAAPETLGITQADWNSVGQYLTGARLGNLGQQQGACFDDRVAREAILFSSLAYLDNPQLPQLSLARIIQDRKKTSAQVGVFKVKNENVLVVAFRGTELGDLGRFTVPQVLEDWWTNLHFGLRPFDQRGGQVHGGFQEAVDKLWDAGLGEVIKEHKGRILVTGHSQGGGLASVLAAKLLTQESPRQVILYAIATPKIGDQTLTDRVTQAARDTNSPLVRISNLRDPVPYLPPFPNFAPGPGFHYHISLDSIDPISDNDYFGSVPQIRGIFDFVGEAAFLAWASMYTLVACHFPGCPEVVGGLRVPGYLRLL